MEQDESLRRVERRGTGLCFIVFPAVWVFAFAAHPTLLDPRRLLGPEALIRRAHGDGLMQLAHALVTPNSALLAPIALHFKKCLEGTSSAWAGPVAALAIVGACRRHSHAVCALTMSRPAKIAPTHTRCQWSAIDHSMLSH